MEPPVSCQGFHGNNCSTLGYHFKTSKGAPQSQKCRAVFLQIRIWAHACWS